MEYQYKAFISYRHKELDRKWAKWLLNKLENYRVPKQLVKQGTPQRIGKLFRDDEEIQTAPQLSEQIIKSLKQSEYLIVICSPNTPNSQWVQKEIETFQDMGKGNKILSLLIEGEPNDSFPSPLLKHSRTIARSDGTVKHVTEKFEPIASDVRPRSDEKNSQTQKRALLRIAATLLNCRYDDLAQREFQRQRRKKHLIISAITTIILILSGYSYYLWDYNREKISYYNNYSEKFFIPFGVGKISESQAKKQKLAYRITKQRRQIIKIQRVSGAKNLARDRNKTTETWLRSISEWKLSYDSSGNIIRKELYDFRKKSILRQSFEILKNKKSGLVIFREGIVGSTSKVKSVAPNIYDSPVTQFGRPSSKNVKKAQVSQHKIIFDENGFIEKRLYQSVSGLQVPDPMGSFGRRYEYNQLGLIGLTSELKKDQSDLITSPNEVYLLRKYNKNGILNEVDILDRDKKITSKMISHINENNNIDEIYEVNKSGELQKHPRGYYYVNLEYDDNGNNIRAIYRDYDRKPILLADGYAVFSQKYDDNGNPIEESLWGISNEPIIDPGINGGYFKRKFKYDKGRNLIEYTYYDINEKLIENHSGFARMTAIHDDDGNRKSKAYFGVDGQRKRISSGISGWTAEYDDYGNMTKQSYFDEYDQPVAYLGLYAIREDKYDEINNIIEQSYYDIYGKPALVQNSDLPMHSKVYWNYTIQGRLAEEIAILRKKVPTSKKEAYRLKRTYDIYGRITEESYYNSDGDRAEYEGYSIFRYYYDQDGKLEKISKYNKNGLLVNQVTEDLIP